MLKFKFQLSWGKLRREPATRWFDWSFAPIPTFDERFARQCRCGPPPEFPLASSYAGIVHHLSGPNRCALTQFLHHPILCKTKWDPNRPVVLNMTLTSALPTFSPSFRILWWDHGLLWYKITIMLAHMLDSLVRVSRRVDWGPLLPRASWTCHLLLPQKTCIQAWRYEVEMPHRRTTTIWELTTNMKAWPPSLESLTPQTKETRFSTPITNPNKTAVAPKDLSSGLKQRMPCGHTFNFLSLSDSNKACTGVIPLSWNNETTSNDPWVLTCLQDVWDL